LSPKRLAYSSSLISRSRVSGVSKEGPEGAGSAMRLLSHSGEGDPSRFCTPWSLLRDGHFVASSG
jgi:hypothetical protein